MDNAVRLNDMTTGHGCYPPQPIITASPNVFVNGRGVVRCGKSEVLPSDRVAPHKCAPPSASHAGQIEPKPPTKVYVNERKPARIMDKIVPLPDGKGCPKGSNFVMTASENVFFGQ